MFKKIITLLVISILNTAFANELSIDIGQTETVFNRISIPSSQSNELSLGSDDRLTSM